MLSWIGKLAGIAGEGGDANVVVRPFLFNFPDFSGRMVFPGRRNSLSSC